MGKIALISGWYTFNGSKGIHENHRFIFECLYKSAKKYFMNKEEVDFIFITNDESILMEDVKNIRIEHKVEGFWHMCLMKILSLKYLNDEYEKIFVIDYDSFFINNIDKNLLNDDFYILQHFYHPTIQSIHNEITEVVPLNFDTTKDFWTMGNFFGGKSSLMLDLLKFTEEEHQRYHKEFYGTEYHFYAKYPEELFLIKYLFEKNINHTRLIVDASPDAKKENLFLSDFYTDLSLYPNIPSTKVIHNTKKDLEKFKIITKHYI